MSKIRVETIGHYHRDHEMNISIGSLPKKLKSQLPLLSPEENRRFLCGNKVQLDGSVDLDIADFQDTNGNEHYLESILKYIKINGWPNNKNPQFVTTRALMKRISGNDFIAMKVLAVKYEEVIFIVSLVEFWYMQNEEKRKTCLRNMANGTSTERYFTQDDEKEDVVRKGVFKAIVPAKSVDDELEVMYAAEIDAIDDKGNHVEIKSLTSRPFYLSKRGNEFYWQMVFANVDSMLIGYRNYERFMISVQRLTRQSYLRVCKAVTVDEGEQRLREFLTNIKNWLKDRDEVAIYKKPGDEDQEISEQEKEEIGKFRETIQRELGSETKFK